MRCKLGPISEPADAVSRVLGRFSGAAAAICGCGWPEGKAATYAHSGTAVAFIISELPESVPKPSSLQWQRWCPRRASIPKFNLTTSAHLSPG
jgi:hypothetical protein